MAPNYPPFSLTFISTKFAPKAGNFSRTKMYHLSFCWHIWKRRHFNLSNKCPLKNEYNINGFIFYTPLHVVLFSNGGKTFVIFHNTGCRLQPTSYTKREEWNQHSKDGVYWLNIPIISNSFLICFLPFSNEFPSLSAKKLPK